MIKRRWRMIGVVSGVALAAGCPDPGAVRPAVPVVREVPPDAVTPTVAAKRFVDDDETSEAQAATSAEVTVVGRIDAGDQPAFDPDRAAFFVSEIIEDPDGGDGHDASTCPFCKRRAARAAKVLVSIIDDRGEPITERADQRFGLTKGDRVSVRGDATFNSQQNLIRLETTPSGLQRH